jgi:phosphopantothenoylcysteine decarboxylase / phosphopantothenate---cysteine ligase
MNVSNPTRLLITAGATLEAIDSVRYLGNRSSGQLGTLLSLAGATNSYEVTLLLGQNSIKPTAHPRLKTEYFSSTRDLHAKLKELWPSHHVLIMAAAVADFTPKGGQATGKIRRGEDKTLDLVPTVDIVKDLATDARADQRILAFALEPQDTLEKVALEKMARKNVDAIVANPLQTMDSANITAKVCCRNGEEFIPPKNIPKSQFANWLISHLKLILQLTD